MDDSVTDPTNNRPAWRLVGTVALGTLLNPLNSSMISVALVRLSDDFDVNLPTVTWVVSGFYLAGGVGQPFMGRLVDMFGPRRIFCSGLVIVLISVLAAVWAPTFGWLVAARVTQAIGTSAAYPAGLSLFRHSTRGPAAPAEALGVLSIANGASAALGPTLGGFLILVADWPAIFLVNVPIAVVALVAALIWMPRGAEALARSRGPRSVRGVLARVDIPGMILFSGTLTGFLSFLLSLGSGPRWPLLALIPVTGAVWYWYERRTSDPFVNVRMLSENPRLARVYAQFAAINVVFYSVFFGMPAWLEEARGLNPGQVGLLMLPLAGLSAVATPVAAWLTRRSGSGLTILAGTAGLSGSTLVLLALSSQASLWLIALAMTLFGVPTAFNNLGFQAALYEAAPTSDIGAAAGLFQTFRYVGSVLSTSVLGVIFGQAVTTGGLHAIAIVIAAMSFVLLGVSLYEVVSRKPAAHS